MVRVEIYRWDGSLFYLGEVLLRDAIYYSESPLHDYYGLVFINAESEQELEARLMKLKISPYAPEVPKEVVMEYIQDLIALMQQDNEALPHYPQEYFVKAGPEEYQKILPN